MRPTIDPAWALGVVIGTLAGVARCDDGLRGWEVVWMAPFLSGGGYSSEAIALALSLSKHVRALSIRQFGEPAAEGFAEGLTDEQYATLATLYRRRPRRRARRLVVCHSTPDVWVPAAFPGWDEIEPCPPPDAALSIGRTMYETDRLPADWVRRCNRMDEVWVPTAFHRDAFSRAGVVAPLVVVPEPVDVRFFDPARHAPLQLPGAASARSGSGGSPPFVFLSVFKWEARKGWDVLLRAYLAEFGAAERVQLVLKTTPFYSTDDFDGLIAQFRATLGMAEGEPAPEVHVLDDELPLAQLPRLYRAASAFVLPSRGEGWGRPHAEAMSMGLPTIATNWSGPTAFMTAENSYPLRVAALVPVDTHDERLRDEGHLWAEPDLDHLRALMRRVFTERQEAAEVGRRARRDMVEHFSPEAVGRIARERLADAVAGRRTRSTKEEL